MISCIGTGSPGDGSSPAGGGAVVRGSTGNVWMVGIQLKLATWPFISVDVAPYIRVRVTQSLPVEYR